MNQNACKADASELKREHNYRYDVKPHLKRSEKKFKLTLKTVEINL